MRGIARREFLHWTLGAAGTGMLVQACRAPSGADESLGKKSSALSE